MPILAQRSRTLLPRDCPRLCPATLVVMALTAVPAVHAQSDFLDRIAGESTTDLDLRYRFEAVDQDNSLEDGRASTLRARLTWQSPTVAGTDALIELDHVTTVGAHAYDSLMPGRYRGTHSVIADPEGTEVNQARIQYSRGSNHALSAGRQRMNHASQRFLGGVGWRQNEQTYDALRYRYSSDFDLDYSYLWNVNRIFEGAGNSVRPANLDSDSHALRVSTPLGAGTLSGWLYALDFDNAPGLSSRTLGLGYEIGLGGLDIQTAWSRQSDHGNRPVDYRNDHLMLELSAPLGPLRARAGYERLGSDDGRAAFGTPLATLHAYQGFADLFLTTPDDGLRDLYLGASGSVSGLSLALSWHDYRADLDDTDHGREWNLSASWPVHERADLQLKLAHYRAATHATDTHKAWLTFELSL